MAGAIQGLIALKNPDYGWERWHSTLLTIAVVTFCVFINVFVARRLPLVESFLALVHFAGLFIVIIVLWTLAPRNNAHDAFLQFSNEGGYASDGVSFMVGLLPLTLCLLGFDSQVHMSEEVAHSAKSIPQSIMFSTYINAFLGFLMVITLIFTWGDMAEIADSPYGWPFLSVFYNATSSAAATIGMTMLIILPLTGSVIACVATASRQIWAFARDNGVSFSGFVRHVSLQRPRTRKPLPKLPSHPFSDPVIVTSRSTPGPPSRSTQSSSHLPSASCSPSSTSARRRRSTPSSHSTSPPC